METKANRKAAIFMAALMVLSILAGLSLTTPGMAQPVDLETENGNGDNWVTITWYRVDANGITNDWNWTWENSDFGSDYWDNDNQGGIFVGEQDFRVYMDIASLKKDNADESDGDDILHDVSVEIGTGPAVRYWDQDENDWMSLVDMGIQNPFDFVGDVTDPYEVNTNFDGYVYNDADYYAGANSRSGAVGNPVGQEYGAHDGFYPDYTLYSGTVRTWDDAAGMWDDDEDNGGKYSMAAYGRMPENDQAINSDDNREYEGLPDWLDINNDGFVEAPDTTDKVDGAVELLMHDDGPRTFGEFIGDVSPDAEPGIYEVPVTVTYWYQADTTGDDVAQDVAPLPSQSTAKPGLQPAEDERGMFAQAVPEQPDYEAMSNANLGQWSYYYWIPYNSEDGEVPIDAQNDTSLAELANPGGFDGMPGVAAEDDVETGDCVDDNLNWRRLGFDNRPGVAFSDDDNNGIVDDDSEIGMGDDHDKNGDGLKTCDWDGPYDDFNGDGDYGYDPEPFIDEGNEDNDEAWFFGPDRQPGVAGTDDDTDANTDVLPTGEWDMKEFMWPGSDDIGMWQFPDDNGNWEENEPLLYLAALPTHQDRGLAFPPAAGGVDLRFEQLTSGTANVYDTSELLFMDATPNDVIDPTDHILYPLWDSSTYYPTAPTTYRTPGTIVSDTLYYEDGDPAGGVANEWDNGEGVWLDNSPAGGGVLGTYDGTDALIVTGAVAINDVGNQFTTDYTNLRFYDMGATPNGVWSPNEIMWEDTGATTNAYDNGEPVVLTSYHGILSGAGSDTFIGATEPSFLNTDWNWRFDSEVIWDNVVDNTLAPDNIVLPQVLYDHMDQQAAGSPGAGYPTVGDYNVDEDLEYGWNNMYPGFTADNDDSPYPMPDFDQTMDGSGLKPFQDEAGTFDIMDDYNEHLYGDDTDDGDPLDALTFKKINHIYEAPKTDDEGFFSYQQAWYNDWEAIPDNGMGDPVNWGTPGTWDVRPYMNGYDDGSLEFVDGWGNDDGQSTWFDDTRGGPDTDGAYQWAVRHGIWKAWSDQWVNTYNEDWDTNGNTYGADLGDWTILPTIDQEGDFNDRIEGGVYIDDTSNPDDGNGTWEFKGKESSTEWLSATEVEYITIKVESSLEVDDCLNPNFDTDMTEKLFANETDQEQDLNITNLDPRGGAATNPMNGDLLDVNVNVGLDPNAAAVMSLDNPSLAPYIQGGDPGVRGVDALYHVNVNAQAPPDVYYGDTNITYWKRFSAYDPVSHDWKAQGGIYDTWVHITESAETYADNPDQELRLCAVVDYSPSLSGSQTVIPSIDQEALPGMEYVDTFDMSFVNDGNVRLYDVIVTLDVTRYIDHFFPGEFQYEEGTADGTWMGFDVQDELGDMIIGASEDATFDMGLLQQLPPGPHRIPVLYQGWYYNDGATEVQTRWIQFQVGWEDETGIQDDPEEGPWALDDDKAAVGPFSTHEDDGEGDDDGFAGLDTTLWYVEDQLNGYTYAGSHGDTEYTGRGSWLDVDSTDSIIDVVAGTGLVDVGGGNQVFSSIDVPGMSPYFKKKGNTAIDEGYSLGDTRNIEFWVFVHNHEIDSFIDCTFTMDAGGDTPFLNADDNTAGELEPVLWDKLDSNDGEFFLPQPPKNPVDEYGTWVGPFFTDLSEDLPGGIYYVPVTMVGTNWRTFEQISATFEVRVEVQPEGPKVVVEKVETTDVIPGETFEMTIQVTNYGDDTARNMFVSVMPVTDMFSPAVDESFLTIASYIDTFSGYSFADDPVLGCCGGMSNLSVGLDMSSANDVHVDGGLSFGADIGSADPEIGATYDGWNMWGSDGYTETREQSVSFQELGLTNATEIYWLLDWMKRKEVSPSPVLPSVFVKNLPPMGETQVLTDAKGRETIVNANTVNITFVFLADAEMIPGKLYREMVVTSFSDGDGNYYGTSPESIQSAMLTGSVTEDYFDQYQYGNELMGNYGFYYGSMVRDYNEYTGWNASWDCLDCYDHEHYESEGLRGWSYNQYLMNSSGLYTAYSTMPYIVTISTSSGDAASSRGVAAAGMEATTMAAVAGIIMLIIGLIIGSLIRGGGGSAGDMDDDDDFDDFSDDRFDEPVDDFDEPPVDEEFPEPPVADAEPPEPPEPPLKDEEPPL